MNSDWNKFAQRVEKTRIYFTHYALFEEPDDNVPPGLYIDAATGQPTQELTLLPPIYERVFSRVQDHAYSAPTQASRMLPYFVDPPGFPPEPPPPPIVGLIAQITGAPPDFVAANTGVLLVAEGQFLAEGATSARLENKNFSVEKDFRFQVRIRTGFSFTPPGNPAGDVSVLVGFLDMGLLHQLIQLPPPPNPQEIVVYDWKAHFTLSTEGKYIRPIDKEPNPVADGFPAGLAAIDFEGQKVDDQGRYTIVGHAKAADVTFTAPPELEQFLFGTNQLNDVEFGLSESGILIPL
jgi:hypothetical protein